LVLNWTMVIVMALVPQERKRKVRYLWQSLRFIINRYLKHSVYMTAAYCYCKSITVVRRRGSQIF
jgi:hypothetical protein